MTGSEILTKSLKLLGYSENDGNAHLTQVIRNRALPIVNLVYAELARTCGTKFNPIKTLTEMVDLPERALNEAICSGVAMYIAQAEGDEAAQAFWGTEYNLQRSTLSSFTEIKDTIPSVWG